MTPIPTDGEELSKQPESPTSSGFKRTPLAEIMCFLTSFSLTCLAIIGFIWAIKMPLVLGLVTAFALVGVLPLLIRSVFTIPPLEQDSSSLPEFA